MEKLEPNALSPWRRMSLLIVDENQYYELDHSEEGLEILRNPSITVMPIQQADIFQREWRILGGARPVPGMLMVLSPHHNDVYAEISEAKNRISVENSVASVNFCRLLGAKLVRMTRVRVYNTESKKTVTVDLAGKTPIRKADAKFVSTSTDELYITDRIQVNAEFAGGQPDIDGARTYLQKKRLDSDPVLLSLLDMRDDSRHSSNDIRSITQEFCLTEALQKTFELMSDLRLGISVFSASLSAKYEKIVKENTEVWLTMEIKFPG